MDTPHPAGSAGASQTDPAELPSASRLSLVVESHRVRRGPRRGFWTAAVATPLLLTGLVAGIQAPPLEAAVSENARAALAKDNLRGVRVVADGRQVTAKVPSGVNEAAVASALTGVSGVSSVTTTRVFASAAEKKACTALQRKVDRATGRQRIAFVGDSAQITGTGAARVRAVAGLLRACRAASATVGGHTDTSTVDGPTVSLERARVVIRMLEKAKVAGNRLEPRGYGDQFPLSEARTAAARAANQRVSITVRVN